MSDFGMFESDEAAANEPRLAARTAARHLEAAIDTVRSRFGKFLLGATGIDEFGDRWHYSKNDIRATVEPYVFPNTGTMRRIQNAMKADWKAAHPYKLALGDGETPTGGPLEGPMDLGFGAADFPESLRPQSEDDLDMPMVDKITQQYHDDPFRKHGPELDPAAGHAGFGEFSRFGPDSWDYDAVNRMTDARQEYERGRTSTRRQALSHDEAGYGQMETDNTRRNQDLDETYHPSSGNLIPQGDFEGWKDSVDQGGPEKVQRDFTPGGDSGSDKHARRIDVEAAKLVADIYTDFARSNGLRVASMDSLNHYASTGIADADYRILANLIRIAEEEKADDEGDDDAEGDDTEDYDFGGEDDAEGDDEAPESDEGDEDESDEDGDGDHDDDDHHTEGDDEDYDFGGGDEGGQGGGGQQYTVPEQAPELSPEMMGEIPQDDASGSAPVPPEVIDSLLGLPEGTIEQLLLEEVEQGAQGGEEGLSGGPMPPQGDPGMGGAPQGGGDDFFGGGGDDAEQEPPRVARRRQAKPDFRKKAPWDLSNEQLDTKIKQLKKKYPNGHREIETHEDEQDSRREARRRSARSFWAAEGDPEQESEGGGEEQAAAAQDPAAAMGGGDPAAMGGQPMMPPPGSGAVAPPAPPAPLENQPAEDALLDTANQAIMQMIDQETAEYQQIIAPLSQALQAVQMAQQVEQAEHPMDVTPPQGTVDVTPSAAPGGQPPMQQQARRQAKKRQVLANAAHLIANTYGVSERMLREAMGRRHYEHVAEAFRILPPQALRSPEVQAAALHIANMFAAENTMFNKNAFMQSVVGPASGSRLPFDRPRTAGETWKNTSTMDIYEHRGAGVQPEITDNMPINDLPEIPGASKHSALTPRQADLMTKLRGWMQRQQDAGNNRGGDSMADQYLSEHPKIGPRGSGQVHEMFNADPHAPGDKAPPKVPEVPVVKAKNPVTRRGSWGEWEPTKQASFFTRKVPGWRWDDHLSGYLSKEARAFTCSCGQKIAAPSYKTCNCGKVWNVYAIGDSHHLASDTAEVYIAREIPVRPGVIMANRKMAVMDFGDGDYHPGEPGDHDFSADTPHNKVLRDYHQHLDDVHGGWHSGELMDDYIETYGIGPEAQKILEDHHNNHYMSPRGFTREDHVQLMSTPHRGWNPDDTQDPFDPRLIGANLKQAKDGGCTCWEGYERVPGTEPCASKSCRKKTGSRAQASHAELVAMIDKLADWTKYDSPDPINDMGKSKPASTSVPKPPKDWATRLPKGDPSKKGGTWTPPTIPRAKK